MVQSMANPSRSPEIDWLAVDPPSLPPHRSLWNSAGQALIADAFLAGEGEESLETIAATRALPFFGDGPGHGMLTGNT